MKTIQLENLTNLEGTGGGCWFAAGLLLGAGIATAATGPLGASLLIHAGALVALDCIEV